VIRINDVLDCTRDITRNTVLHEFWSMNLTRYTFRSSERRLLFSDAEQIKNAIKLYIHARVVTNVWIFFLSFFFRSINYFTIENSTVSSSIMFYNYIPLYICVCVCVCVFTGMKTRFNRFKISLSLSLCVYIYMCTKYGCTRQPYFRFGTNNICLIFCFFFLTENY